MSTRSKINIQQQTVSRFRVYLSAAIIFLWLLIGYLVFNDIAEFINWFDDYGVWVSVIYCLMVTIAIVLLVPINRSIWPGLKKNAKV